MQDLVARIAQWLHTVGLHAGPDTVRTVGDGAAHAVARMDMPGLLALAAALGWASGFRLYAVTFLVGLLGALDWIALPSGLHVLQAPLVLGASGFMLVVEFFADKVPWLDSLWDAVHSVIRIPAGALLAAGVFGADDATMGVAAGLLGGSLAAASFATKATVRAAINTSPEPFSNGLASLFEDGLVVGTVWLATRHPLAFGIALCAALTVSALLLAVLFRFLRIAWARMARLFGREAAASPR